MSLDWIPTNWIVHPCRKQGFISSTQKKKRFAKKWNNKRNLFIYFDKNNSREYIMWVEKHFVGKEPSLSFSKASLKKSNQRNRKKEGFVV